MNCDHCNCALIETEMTFEFEYEDGGDIHNYRICLGCVDDTIECEEAKMIAVWKFGTSIEVDEDEEFDMADYKDHMFASDETTSESGSDDGSDDGFEKCDCGYIHHHEDKCPQGKSCAHYEKWRKDECAPKEAKKVVGKSCCSTCGIQGHNKNNKKFHPKEEEDCCFKCGNTGVFGETHFYAQPEKDGKENLYCNDCDVKSWYDV
jgi:hypothetical protein